MGIADIFNVFRNGTKKVVDITAPSEEYGQGGEIQARIALYAIYTVADRIASIISKVEWKTYDRGEFIKGREWVNLNYAPNKNQSSTEFWKEVIFKLLVKQEVLIVPFGEQKIIADNFDKEDYAIAESIFSGVTRGTFTFQKYFRSSDVFYLKYSNKDLTALLMEINTRYSELFSEAYGKYIKSGGSKAILDIPAMAAGAPDFEQRFEKLKNEQLQTFFKRKNAVLPMFNGMKYTEIGGESGKKAANEITDIKALVDEAIIRAAQVYKYPPQLIKGEVSAINDAVDYMLTICISPLVNEIGEEMTAKQFTPQEIIDGCYIEGDCSGIKHMDIFSAAANIDKLIADGVVCVDEIRPQFGYKELNTEESRAYVRTKNYENVTTNGGGENEEKAE